MFVMSHDHGGATNINPASQSRTSHVKTHKLPNRIGTGHGPIDEVVDVALVAADDVPFSSFLLQCGVRRRFWWVRETACVR